MKKKQLNFIESLKMNKNMTFGADADIYTAKKIFNVYFINEVRYVALVTKQNKLVCCQDNISNLCLL